MNNQDQCSIQRCSGRLNHLQVGRGNAGFPFCDQVAGYLDVYPGEGVIINTGAAFTQKCVGRLRQDSVNKEISSLQAVHSSLVALAGTTDGALRFPVAHGDTISRMTGTDGSYTTYMYQNGSWTPSQPSISLGEAFWSNKSRPAIWRQNHSVW